MCQINVIYYYYIFHEFQKKFIFFSIKYLPRVNASIYRRISMTNSNVSFLLLETIFLFGAQIRSAWKAELFELKVSAVTETFRSSNCIFICLQIQMDMNLYNLHDINIILCLLYYVNYYNNLQNLYSNICEYVNIYIYILCLHFPSDHEPNGIWKKIHDRVCTFFRIMNQTEFLKKVHDRAHTFFLVMNQTEF